MMEVRIVGKNIQVVTLFLIVLAVLLETSDARNIGYSGSGGGFIIIHSKSYPSLYPNSYEEYWTISIADEYRLRLEFDDFSTERCGGIKCTCDYLAIYDGTSEHVPPSAKFCGNDIPSPFLSKSRNLIIVFKTDSSQVRKGFRAFYTIDYDPTTFITDESERNMINYFLKIKRQQKLSINKWGRDITRSAVALFLSDPQFFAAGNETGEEIAYELTLQLMSKLVTKKRISTKDLALSVNALTVACIDPKNFYGLNLVAELRKRVDSSNDTNPFFLLALCIGGDDMKTEDIYKLQLLFQASLRPSWTDTQAMVVMALKCITRQSTFSNATIDWNHMLQQLKRKQQSSGIIENLKTTALVVQALIATDDYKSSFNMTMAIKSIVKDLEHAQADLEEMYYALPIIRLKSLVHINSNHCASTIRTDLEEMKVINKDPEERIQIQISIIIGDNEDFSRTWKIKVPPSSSFYQAFQLISSSDPDYKIQYTNLEGKPYIEGVSNFKNSVEDGSFWFIYATQLSSADDLVLVEASPVDIKVDEGTKLILWYRSESRHATQDVLSNADSTIVDSTTIDSTQHQ